MLLKEEEANMSPNNIVNVNLGDLENSCFVVMPFGSLFEAEYESSIKPVIEKVGLKCIRADEVYAKARIMDDIWRCIRSCIVVLAELTDRNPNVLYEVGLAHAIGKPVIIITRKEDDVPFDLRSLRYLFYDTNDPYWGENLHKALENMLTKVIEEATISEYLEGIKLENEIKFPEIKGEAKREKGIREELTDVSGVWRVHFYVSKESGTQYHGLMTIQQKESELSATMTITYDKGEEMCVVQELFSGSLEGDSVRLHGVNYSWVRKVGDSGYLLDDFELKISLDTKRMVGKFMSKVSVGKAYFRKKSPAGVE